MRLEQTKQEQDISAEIMAEQNTLPVINGIVLGMQMRLNPGLYS